MGALWVGGWLLRNSHACGPWSTAPAHPPPPRILRDGRERPPVTRAFDAIHGSRTERGLDAVPRSGAFAETGLCGGAGAPRRRRARHRVRRYCGLWRPCGKEAGLSMRNEICLFCSLSLRTAGGQRWRDSVNRRRLAFSGRRLADDPPQALGGWRSAEVQVYGQFVGLALLPTGGLAHGHTPPPQPRPPPPPRRLRWAIEGLGGHLWGVGSPPRGRTAPSLAHARRRVTVRLRRARPTVAFQTGGRCIIPVAGPHVHGPRAWLGGAARGPVATGCRPGVGLLLATTSVPMPREQGSF